MIATKRVETETDDSAAAADAVKSRPRRMLSEKQVLEIVPISRTTLFRMEKAGRFPNRLTSHRTAGFGSKIPPRVPDDRDTPLKWERDGGGYRLICDF
jgi:hypothetical protein